MKVIDLLNKIANREEVPEKIKVDNIIYIYESWEHFYYTDNEAREDLLIRGKDYSTNDFLNWNVELIEDEPIDIDNIEELELIGTNFIDMDKNELKDNINKNRINLNKLVQAVKQLNKEIKSIKEKR